MGFGQVQPWNARSRASGRAELPLAESDGRRAGRKGVELSAFFDRLRLVLNDRGMSQAELARQLEVGDATVSEWFTRGRAPQGDVLLRLPRLLAVNGHWLLTGDGPRDPTPSREGDPYSEGFREALGQIRGHLDELEGRLGGSSNPPRIPPAAGKPRRSRGRNR